MSEDFAEGQIYVDYQGVDQIREDLLHHTGEIKKLLANLDQELTPLKASWSGDDADAYNTKQQAWNQLLETMALQLTQNSNLLEEIRHSYQRHENNVANLWSGVRV